MCLKHQSQLAQSLLSCSKAFQFSSKVEVLILLFTFLQFYSVVPRDSKVDNFANSLFLLLIITRYAYKNTDTRTPKISNITKLAMDGRSPLYRHGKTLSLPPPSRVLSYILYHHMTYICYFVASYLFLFSHSCSLWCYFVLQFGDSVSLLSFPFLAISRSFRGARGVMVIVVGNGHGDTATRVQILDETDCISHSTNTLGKGMNPIILPPAMDK